MELKYNEITEDQLKKLSAKFYGTGNRLNVGDKVYVGYINRYADLNGTPPTEYNPSEVSLSMQFFVEKDGKLYQLYAISR